MTRLRDVVTRRRVLGASAAAAGLIVLLTSWLWLFDGWAVSYAVAARILVGYALALFGVFVWRDRVQARERRELVADLDQLWTYVGQIRDWLAGGDEDRHAGQDDVDVLDRPTPAQQAAPTRPDLEAQHPSPDAGRHRAPAPSSSSTTTTGGPR